ncbi:hypothetical protein SAMN05216302_102158 [Nitrosomonas aestuarii]|uniref:Uncharacterized protein n=1 Tax=Nitrosomonas aestuarii TaxID=52441 RepID=A0A1I4DHJ9_9PROT|nr:hypothetical protein [Nitrosomonas aestuarii]SFK93064.1 hypothetical protein SAMN05216302_102158 [Nitrosomonas aestuarii]
MGGKIIKLGDYNKPKQLKRFLGSANGICYTGLSRSFRSEESDVILVAASIGDLKKQWTLLTDLTFHEDCVEQVAVFRFQDMRGKRLWK